jgi:predicted nucleic acid-binding protein
MKPVCCDTSFLISLYGYDGHTQKATAYARHLNQPLTLSVFNQFEFEQAVRLAVWRKLTPPSDGTRFLAGLERDYQSGQSFLTACDLPATIAEARRLSSAYTPNGGYRSFDILHVAVALHLRAELFLSFDTNQRKLAKAEGLKLNP